ncbi:Mg-chelatase subunit ChlI domain protein [Selenomonas sp. CM52]|nr:Mg-chelatase subunit ChlI domain protein [Selenomonas sp. CM52]
MKESRERVRTAIKNTGVKLKPARVTINLAPADIRKDSSRKEYQFSRILWH